MSHINKPYTSRILICIVDVYKLWQPCFGEVETHPYRSMVNVYQLNPQ